MPSKYIYATDYDRHCIWRQKSRVITMGDNLSIAQLSNELVARHDQGDIDAETYQVLAPYPTLRYACEFAIAKDLDDKQLKAPLTQLEFEVFELTEDWFYQLPEEFVIKIIENGVNETNPHRALYWNVLKKTNELVTTTLMKLLDTLPSLPTNDLSTKQPPDADEPDN